jgi:hypothetical protein
MVGLVRGRNVDPGGKALCRAGRAALSASVSRLALVNAPLRCGALFRLRCRSSPMLRRRVERLPSRALEALDHAGLVNDLRRTRFGLLCHALKITWRSDHYSRSAFPLSWDVAYGGTVEWYQNWWTLRAGMFDLSTVPNSNNLSPNFAQLQFVTEIEGGTSYGASGAISNFSIGFREAISAPILTRFRSAWRSASRLQPRRYAHSVQRTGSASTSKPSTIR